MSAKALDLGRVESEKLKNPEKKSDSINKKKKLKSLGLKGFIPFKIHATKLIP